MFRHLCRTPYGETPQGSSNCQSKTAPACRATWHFLFHSPLAYSVTFHESRNKKYNVCNSQIHYQRETEMALVSAVRGGRLTSSLHHHHHLGSSSSSSSVGSWGSLRPWKQLNSSSSSKRFALLARYSQAQDLFSSRFQGTQFLNFN